MTEHRNEQHLRTIRFESIFNLQLLRGVFIGLCLLVQVENLGKWEGNV